MYSFKDEKRDAKRRALIVAGIECLLEIPFNFARVGMGVFAIMIYVINEGYKVTGTTTCQLHVILLLTLIAGCIDVLFGALNVLAGGVKTLEVACKSSGKPGVFSFFVIYSLGLFLFIQIGLTIALCFLIFMGTCGTEKPAIMTQIEIYLVFSLILGVITCCYSISCSVVVAGCAGLCNKSEPTKVANYEKLMDSDHEDSKPDDRRRSTSLAQRNSTRL